jgi:hypothetical protein
MRSFLFVSLAVLLSALACGNDDAETQPSLSPEGGSGGVEGSADSGASGAQMGTAGQAGLADSGSAGAGGEVDPITPDNVREVAGDPTSQEDLQRLAEWMTGAFDSKDMQGQSEVDSAGVYTYIWADLEQVRIWPKDAVGYWLYVEQSEHGQVPYRTRIYHLKVADETTYVIDSYKLPYGSTKFAGAFEDPTVFDGLSLEDTGAVHNPDCNVVIKRKNGKYYGYNDPTTCTVHMGSELNLDSFSIVGENSFYSHDRGYTSTGTLKMGPENRGYTFVKRVNYPIE